MKFSGIVTAMIGLGAGVAAGSLFAPEIRREIGTFTPAVTETQPAKSAAAGGAAQEQETAVAPAPVAAKADLSALLREENAYRRLRELAPYVAGLRPEEIPGVLDKVEAAHGPGRDNLLEVLAGRWVELDPQGALAAARQKTTRGVAENFYDAFYGAWANRDPSGAVAAVQQLPEGGERGEAIWAVIYQIGDSYPAQAQELFKSIHGANLSNGNHFIYAHWAEKDLNQATSALLQKANFAKRGARSDAVEGIADHLLEKDPQAAADWLAQLPAGKIHDEAEDRIVAQWSRTDPQAALGWLQSLPPSEQKNQGVQKAMFQWADQDPPAALGYAAALPDGGLKPFLMERCVRDWARADGPAALRWAQNLPASAKKNETLLQVIKDWAGADPAAAAAGLAAMPEEQPAAVASLHSLPPTSARTPNEETYADVAKAWAKIDPAPSGVWLNQLPAGPERNAAVAAYSDQIAGVAPGQAVQMAESINDAGDRDRELVQLLTAWLEADPDAAALAVQGSSLPDDAKKQLLGSKP